MPLTPPPLNAQKPQGYVLGFMLDEARERVVLIRKETPAWQAGKLNGVGGKMEEGEIPSEAMAREFLEETGVVTSTFQWEPIGWMQGEGFIVHLFRTLDGRAAQARTTTAERVMLQGLKDLSLVELETSAVPGLGVVLARVLDPRKVSLVLQQN